MDAPVMMHEPPTVAEPAATRAAPGRPAVRRTGPALLRRPVPSFHGLIGRTPAMEQLFATMARFAPHARTTLITGEVGTGKAAVARTLYRLGPHRGGAFVPIVCAGAEADDAAWPPRGAAAPADATYYYADVADLAAPDQRRLLRLVAADDAPAATGPHVIAATAQDLPAAMAAGRFRSDLFYRLGVFTLHLPALRERPDDLPALASAFLADVHRRLGLAARGLTPGALGVLQAHSWPGNLRELQNVLERAAVLSDHDVVGEGAVRAALAGSATTPGPQRPSPSEPPPTGRLDEAQRAHVRAVLRGEHGNKSRAAARLGISRRALYRLLARLGA
ncbi:MAG: sigma 54-interacting transcriptional regulator [Vicinamibacterales bacterium]